MHNSEYFKQHIDNIKSLLNLSKNSSINNDDIQFNTILNITPNCILIIQNNKIIETNNATLTLLGYKNKTNLIGKNYSEITHPDYLKIINERLSNLSHGKANDPIVIKYLSNTKQDDVFAQTISISINYNNKPAYLIIGRDITNEHKLNEQLNENKYLLNQTEKITKTGSYKINLKTGKAIWTNGVYNIFDYPQSQALPDTESYYKMVYPDDRKILELNLLDTINNNKPFDLEYRIITTKGQIKQVRSKSKVQIENNVPYLVGSFIDISEQKETELIIKTSEKKYRNLIEKMPVGIVKFNTESIVFANNAFIKMLGATTKDEIEGQNIIRFIDKLEHERFYTILESLKQQSSNTKFLLTLKAKNNTRLHIELWFYYVIESENPLYKCIVENISSSIKTYNREKKMATDAVFISRKIETYEQIRNQLDQIIDNKNIDKTIFADLFSTLSTEWDLEQLWAIFQSNFDKVESGFFQKLLSISPNLSQQELKHCAFIRLNFGTKEIATMFQVKPSSIQIARVRLKKKLNLPAEENLITFILLL